jgi:hypothetical protein
MLPRWWVMAVQPHHGFRCRSAPSDTEWSSSVLTIWHRESSPRAHASAAGIGRWFIRVSFLGSKIGRKSRFIYRPQSLQRWRQISAAANETHHCCRGLGDGSPVGRTAPCTLANHLLLAGSPPLQQVHQSLLKALGLWPRLQVSRVLKDLAAAAARSGMARREQIKFHFTFYWFDVLNFRLHFPNHRYTSPEIQLLNSTRNQEYNGLCPAPKTHDRLSFSRMTAHMNCFTPSKKERYWSVFGFVNCLDWTIA